jgi:hypothetical protein
MLTLPEELMLLALDDAQGTVTPNAQQPLRMGLVSATLTELTLTGKLRFDANGNVIVANAAPTGDGLLDEIVDRIGRATPPRPAPQWLQYFTNAMPNIEGRVIDKLVQRGALRVEESRRFLILKEPRFPQGNSGFEQSTKNRLRDVVLNGAQPDERTMALIGLVKMCNLVETVFPYTEWEQVRRRIDELTSPQFAGWQYQAQPGGNGYEQQPMPAGGMMMGGFVNALMFSMMAQSLFWGVGGWGVPGVIPGMAGYGDPMQEGEMPFGDDATTEVDSSGDFGGDFGDFGGDFGGDI